MTLPWTQAGPDKWTAQQDGYDIEAFFIDSTPPCWGFLLGQGANTIARVLEQIPGELTPDNANQARKTAERILYGVRLLRGEIAAQ